MSVWASDAQIVDLFRSVYTCGPSFRDLALPASPGSYLACDARIVPPECAESWEDFATMVKWPTVYDDPEESEDLIKHVESVTSWRYGLHAVYTLLHHTMRGRFTCRQAFQEKYIEDCADELITLITPSTQITPKRFTERTSRKCVDTYSVSTRFEDLAEALKHSRVLFSTTSKGYREIDHNKFLGGPGKSFVGVVFNDLMVFAGRGRYQQVGLVLCKQHLDYLIGASTRIHNTVQYLLRQHTQADADAGIEFLVDSIRNAYSTGQANSNYVARAYHKLRAIFQMEILASEFDVAVLGEIADYYTDGLDQIVPLQVNLDKLRAVRTHVAMEIVHIYKWMPPPDFDATSAPTIVQDFHENHRSSGLGITAAPDLAELYARIKVERKINLAEAYRSRHNTWPAGLSVRGRHVSPRDVEDWDCAGIEVYHQMGTDLVGQVKDKTIVSASKDRELNGNKKTTDRSYLLWYMANAGTIDTVNMLANPSLIAEDNYVRVAYKPEAHKPDSRLFYMAPPVQRTLLGELEGNLKNFARFYPGSLMSKDSADKRRITAEIMDIHKPCENIPARVDYTTYIITFDLSKFSPKSAPEVTKEYHNFWAKVYGQPGINWLYNVGCTSSITHTTAGVQYEYQNPGCDLEGFRGKMMTMFHSDMLAAALRLAREREVIVGRSKLAVFIDDGAAKVAVKGMGSEARENAAALLGILKEVYASAGQDNNPTKTVVSQTGGEILAQFYYRGLLVPQGIKALMRLAPDYENAAATFSEEMDQLYATTQGAVKDGANWAVAYRLLAEACIKSLCRWIRAVDRLVLPHAMAMKLITPKSFGGLGFTSLQALVTNASTNQTIEGAAMLNRLARNYPQYALEVKGIISAGVVRRDPVAILRDPLRVRLSVPVLIENRLTMEVVRWLEENAGEYTRFLAAYKEVALLEHAKGVAEALLQSGVVSVPLFERAWKSTPLAYVESVVGKFKRSATIISLLGGRRMGKIRNRNMSDLKQVLCI